ncbi:hypothetical protein [Sphingomonas sp.]|uniref:hypothetical protein n=1 Tax=Sphingomonas sp. TaxID=28214 RepID=UPI002DD61BA5|nr:hypothetical protein [Sphingomonas sp.]
MTDRDDAPRSRRTLWLVVAGVLAMLGLPFVIGIYQGYTGGEARPMLPWAVLAGIAGLVGVIATGVWLAARDRARHPPSGPGEAAAVRNSRSFWLILGTLFFVGMLVGAGAAMFEIDAGGFMTGTLPAWFAIVAAVVTVLALTVGTVLFLRRVDEVERADNIWASAVGANALLIVYPPWFFLWKGGWVSEPSHYAMAGILFAAMMIAYGYRKIR